MSMNLLRVSGYRYHEFKAVYLAYYEDAKNEIIRSQYQLYLKYWDQNAKQ